MSTPNAISRSRALAELATQSQQVKEVWLRVRLSNGTSGEGQLFSIEPTQLELLDTASGAIVRVMASEIIALDVRAARRGREWILAGAAIVGATVALIGYAKLPWVRPGKGDMTGAFMLLYSAAGALFPILLARTRLRQWLTTWRALYPPSA